MSSERVIKSNCLLKVFPNPATNKIEISGDFRDHDILSVVLHSLTGEKNYDLTLKQEGGKYMTNISHLAKGIYILEVRVQDGSSLHVEKLIIY